MSWREEYRYYAKCSGVAENIADKICDEVDSLYHFSSEDERYFEAGKRFWALVNKEA